MFEPAWSLSQVPTSVAEAGRPRFGTYRGELPEVDWGHLGARWVPSGAARRLRRKRWHYLVVATPEVLATCSVVDTGFSAAAFVSALDLKERRPLGDVSFSGAPLLAEVGDRPGAGLVATYRTLGGRVAMRRGEEERYQVEVEVSRLRSSSLQGLRWEGGLVVAGGPPALTVIAPVGGEGTVNVTQKRGALLAVGSLQAGGRRWRLDGGVGGTDYTQGFLARHTAWRWAFATGRLADGTPLGLNLVEGFNEDPQSNENALWLGDRVYPLARARFTYDKHELLDPWRVVTVDGAVDVRFRPLYVHREDHDFRWAVSHFAQPMGLFEGTVRLGERTLKLEGVPGVTEQQDVLW